MKQECTPTGRFLERDDRMRNSWEFVLDNSDTLLQDWCSIPIGKRDAVLDKLAQLIADNSVEVEFVPDPDWEPMPEDGPEPVWFHSVVRAMFCYDVWTPEDHVVFDTDRGTIWRAIGTWFIQHEQVTWMLEKSIDL